MIAATPILATLLHHRLDFFIFAALCTTAMIVTHHYTCRIYKQEVPRLTWQLMILFILAGGVFAEIVGAIEKSKSNWMFGILLYRLAALSLTLVPIIILIASTMIITLCKTSEARFRSLVSNIPGAIYRYIPKSSSFEFLSDKIKEISGYLATDFIGTSARPYESIIHPDEKEMVRCSVEKALAEKQPYAMEYKIKTAQGEVRWIYEKGQALYDSKGAVLLLDGAIFDVTGRKQLEEQFRQSQKMEVIGRLAGGIAHDFNNMITVISGYSAALMRDFKEEDQSYKILKEIRKAAEKSAALTRQLLAFSRRQVLQPKVIDLNDVISNSNEMFCRLIGENIQLTAEAAQDLKRVKVDPSQIEQVILNLIVNSRDAMPRGGKINIKTANAILDKKDFLQHHGVKAGKYVVLSVKDTGLGMNDEVKAHIFEPFFTTKEEGKGTGLGLATVFGIVKQSEGCIEVDSAPEKGAIFKIYLPAVEDKITETPKVKLTLPKQQYGSETILVVEDENVLRSLVRKILEMNGYTVLEAEHGEKAISLCKEYKNPIHLLLTDFVMPFMNGEDLGKTLLALRPTMKVIYVSGYADQHLKEQKILEPDIPFLQKPFTPDVLTHKVREVLDQ